MAKAKFEIKRKCEVCGTMFYAKTIESKYCCKKCIEIASKKKKAEKEKLAKMEEVASNIPDSRDYITVQEAIAMYSVSKGTIYRLIRKGRAADLAGQLGDIDLVAFLFHDIHHIDRDDHGDAQLCQLRR